MSFSPANRVPQHTFFGTQMRGVHYMLWCGSRIAGGGAMYQLMNRDKVVASLEERYELVTIHTKSRSNSTTISPTVYLNG